MGGQSPKYKIRISKWISTCPDAGHETELNARSRLDPSCATNFSSRDINTAALLHIFHVALLACKRLLQTLAKYLPRRGSQGQLVEPCCRRQDRSMCRGASRKNSTPLKVSGHTWAARVRRRESTRPTRAVPIDEDGFLCRRMCGRPRATTGMLCLLRHVTTAQHAHLELTSSQVSVLTFNTSLEALQSPLASGHTKRPRPHGED